MNKMNCRLSVSSFCVFVVLVVSCTAPVVEGQTSLRDIAEAIDRRVTRVLGSLDQSLGNLFADMRNFTRAVDNVASCYSAQLKGRRMDIFNNSAPFKSVATDYYNAFPNKQISVRGVRNLLDSTRDIITRCIDSQGANNSSSVQYGFTSLSDKSLDELNELLGLIEPEPIAMDDSMLLRGKRLSGDDPRCVADQENVPSSFDWRDRNVVTPVRDQGQCGSCWTFASTDSLESALLINNKTDVPVNELNLSKQQLVQCAKFLGTGCEGGNSQMAFSYIQRRGVTTNEIMPYRARDGICPYFRSFPDRVSIENYCIRSQQRYSSSSLVESLSDQDIIQSLVHYGPLYIAINADPLSTRNYRGGVLDDPDCSTQINHAVTLVGYTNTSWIIKNSWGEQWGDGGYFQVARGKNMCGVNTEIAWPLLS